MVFLIGVTALQIGIITIALLFVYILALLIVNVYITLSPKSAALLMVLGMLMGMELMALILNSVLYTALMLVITILYGLFILIRGARQRSRRTKVSTMNKQNSN
jgi:hypothetical protein